MMDPTAVRTAGTAEVWARLGRPFDAVEVVDALLGLSMSMSRHVVGSILATSAEAEELLDRMPQLVRALAVSTTSSPERHHGEVRGPVLWSETMSARASSAGDTGLFVCASPTKAYDTDENRVLVAALESIHRAARGLEALDDEEDEEDESRVRRARANGNRSVRFLEHRTLASVTKTRPDGRAVRRARAGTKRQTYLPAVAMLDRAAEPLDVEHAIALADDRTSAQHRVLAAVARGIELSGLDVPPFRIEHGALRAGPVRYIHPRGRADASRLHGIVVGDLLVDVPTPLSDTNTFRAQAHLGARGAGRRTFVVMVDSDIPRAVELAIRYAAPQDSV